jgi:anhydro-N-acetylmuramic acid kinase
MVVAGVMSGTSADGINVALVRIRASNVRGPGRPRHTVELVGHAEYSYSARVRAAVLAAMNAENARVADLARLSFILGELYADAVLAAERRFHIKAALIGCHGQTLYHQGEAGPFLGRRVAATWQTGEGAIIAARVGVPVVSDFRPADMAAGGKGAPLVPYLDYLLFRDAKVGRIMAFDTGPGNMVIDAVTEALFHRSFDRGGAIAASGKALEPILKKMLSGRFFRQKPPKTAGREEFGREFVREFLRMCGSARKQDVMATATALTAQSIGDAVQRFVIAGGGAKGSYGEMIVSGGGARNRTLMAMLRQRLTPLGIQLRFSGELGLPSAAKEAVAFAVLAYETWNRRPSNVPSATGARQAAVLGKISYA